MVILPSPLLPAHTYRGLRLQLTELGHEVSIADGDLRGGTGTDLAERWAAEHPNTDIYVPHSNAGLLAPLVRAAQGSSAAIVFVDAALLPERGPAPLAPVGLRRHLTGIAGPDGLLPAWTRWWPEPDMMQVMSAAHFTDIDEASPLVQLSYFDGQVIAPAGWAEGRNAYLAFGPTYSDETSFAREHGWPLRVERGAHLHFLAEPVAVAQAVNELADALG